MDVGGACHFGTRAEPCIPDDRCAGDRAVERRSRCSGRRLRLVYWAFGMREDDASARHCRSRAGDVRLDHRQWPFSQRGAAEARLWLRVPGAGAIPLANRRAECRAAARIMGLDDKAGASSATSIWSISRASRRSFPGSFRAACSSASRSPARWPSIQSYC